MVLDGVFLTSWGFWRFVGHSGDKPLEFKYIESCRQSHSRDNKSKIKSRYGFVFLSSQRPIGYSLHLSNCSERPLSILLLYYSMLGERLCWWIKDI